ncbi:3-oxoadipate enol-lactonase [Chelatococcus sp. SYSU_G07232]|uniref:3-oxoadipate enol-lactonase n=1 Tax=Chelatococcus albus TaxID=3047466 RepID=A0ABT7AGB6_9HYPH|nr:3-oxoadipate enol-lactonase [Chelatococcus sp. SYSU_G07232]MDJ1158401.1 3-oxoadipate enol-lactonase [Chelatococcus sp. SYSU_G07232]
MGSPASTLVIGGETFNIQIDGADCAPVLMLSNSLGTDLSMWDAQVAEWARHFRVLRYDSRGHGKSTAPDRPYSIAELGRDALNILDALGIAKAHWCGLSKGGMVGMWLATHAPERFGRVVLANTSAHMGPPDLWNGRIRTVRKDGMAGVVDAIIERWFTPGYRAQAPAALAAVRQVILATPPHGYAGCCSAIRDMDQREAIRAIALPTLVIVGSADPATPPAVGELIRERIANSQLVTLEAAHLSNLEQPEAFTQAVLRFLKG